MENVKKRVCGFCGTTKGRMIEGATAYICEDCLDLSHDKISELRLKQNNKTTKSRLRPSEIINNLNNYVINQKIAKEKIAAAIYDHQKLLAHKDIYGDNLPVEIEKSNILLVGPTGSGKTHIAKTLAKILNVPISINDATNLTAAGYVGEDVENCLRKLIEAADGDVELAQRGIVYIDEIDKIGRKGENPSITRDVSGEGVQQALLKIVEGTVSEVPPKGGRKHPDQQCIKIDTSNILFIIGGSFEGIEKIIAKRKQGKASMGFGAKIADKNSIDFNSEIHDLRVDDLKSFGMLPEFLGRFPIIATLDELDEEALINILTKPRNALIKQKVELYKMDNVELEFTDDALNAIAKEAIKRKTGARALRAIVEEILLPYTLMIPDNPRIIKIVIDGEVVSEGKKAKIVYKERKIAN